jgi:hypothetical protein
MGTEKERFMLEPVNENRFVRIIQVAFGIICIIVALVWVVLNFTTFNQTTTVWITIIFLSGFGYFQIVSGLGKATRFVEFRKSEVFIKPHSLLPVRRILNSEIDRIEIYPLSIVFLLQSGRKAVLRFGVSNTEIISQVKDGTEEFADKNGLNLSFQKEDL